MKLRIGWAATHPIQYQVPIVRALNDHPGVEGVGLFFSDFSLEKYYDPQFKREIQWDVDLLSGYQSVFLPPLRENRPPFSLLNPINRGFGRALRDAAIDLLIVNGYSTFSHMAISAAARMRGIPVILRGEDTLISEKRSPLRKALKRIVMPLLFARYDGFLAVGTLNEAYYRYYLPRARITRSPYNVDNAFFQHGVSEAKREGRAAIRRRYGLPDDGARIFLYASKLTPRKHPDVLLEAFTRVRERHPAQPCHLVFVGEGELRARLEAEVSDRDDVHFLGFINQSELPAIFYACDLFVLASSYEPWGLITNEVMNAERPLILSDQVGAAPDLVEPGRNGWVIPAGNVGALERALGEALHADLDAMGRASLEIINRWGIDEAVQGVLEMAEQTVPGYRIAESS